METAVASGAESDDTVRILKDIRDEIRHARNELREEIRGVRTERIDRPDRGRLARAPLFVGIGLLVLSGALLFSRGRGPRVEREPVAREVPAPLANLPIHAPAAPVAATAPIAVAATTITPVRATAPVVIAPKVAAEAAPKRAPAHHKVRPPTEAELEEPAKL
jgi:hypothetical protein